MSYKETTEIVEGTCKIIRQHIRDARETFFHVVSEKDGIIYGDLILLNLNTYQSLIDSLVKAKLLSRNETLFTEGKIKLLLLPLL